MSDWQKKAGRKELPHMSVQIASSFCRILRRESKAWRRFIKPMSQRKLMLNNFGANAYLQSAPIPVSAFIPGSKKEKTLIIGAGEIGKSLAECLKPIYEVYLKDVKDDVRGEFEVINICYPYSKDFVKITQAYIKKYNPKLTIIHSTIKPGTSRLIGKNVVHSPVNGKHPNLAQSLKIFVKFIGGMDSFSTFKAVDYLNRAGIRTQVFASPETTELAKVLCTTRYGWAVMEMKETARLCEQYGVPFHEVYTE